MDFQQDQNHTTNIKIQNKVSTAKKLKHDNKTVSMPMMLHCILNRCFSLQSSLKCSLASSCMTEEIQTVN